MKVERVEVIKNHGNNGIYVDVTVIHKQTGSSYGIPLSREAYEQLRDYFLNQNPSDSTPLKPKLI